MKLYLCEKPSQAKDIAAVIGGDRRKQSFIETKDGIVTWAIGHLVEQWPPDKYNPSWERWSWESLPMLPAEFRVAPKHATKDQYQAVKKLIKDASHIVIATDADREGEMIARELLDEARYRGPISRLWLSALDPDSVRKALARLKSDDDTKPLYYAALARSRGDWIVGMNMTRAITLRCRKPTEKGVISIGRVQTPTLALVVRRDREIENFKPTNYYEIVADVLAETGAEVQLRHAPREEERILDLAKAEQIAKDAKGVTAPLKVTKTHKNQAPPKLYSLAGFQMRANALYGWPATKSLAIAQALYETHKATTYPRTDCEYLPEEQIESVPKIVANLKSLPEFSAVDIGKPIIRKTVFNTSKVTAHHAIIPTTVRPDLSKMSDDERKGFFIIAKSFLACLLPDYEYEQTRISMTAGVEFSVIGNVPTKLGWRAVYTAADKNDKEPTLPAIPDGTPGTVQRATVEAKKTKPPDHYTEGTLIADMKAIGKFVTDPKKKARLKETSGIGTEATRANIINGLQKREFLQTQGKKILSTQKGRHLIEVLEKHLPALADAGETAIWEEGLEMIVARTLTHEEFTEKIGKRVSTYLSALGAVTVASAPSSGGTSQRSTATTAPQATGSQYKGKPITDCGDYYRFEAVEGYFRKELFGRKMTPADYVKILEAGKDGLEFKDLVSKDGKTYTGRLAYTTKTKFNGKPGIELKLETNRERRDARRTPARARKG